MNFNPRRAKAKWLKRQLLESRTGASRLDAILLDPYWLIAFDRTGWISAWVDLGNIVASRCGRMSATRGITAHGRFIWLVRSSDGKRRYHARSADPYAAMREAETAWRRGREMADRSEAVRRIVRELRFFRVRHDVTVDDAYTSALCADGVEGFLRALRLTRIRRYPGWLVTWLYPLDRQVGFVLYEARQRWLRERADGADACVVAVNARGQESASRNIAHPRP